MLNIFFPNNVFFFLKYIEAQFTFSVLNTLNDVVYSTFEALYWRCLYNLEMLDRFSRFKRHR
jgi:hypothetical protein